MIEIMLGNMNRESRFKLVSLRDSPYAASQRSACSLNNKIYVAGGLSETTTSLTNFDVYDIPTDTWTNLQSLPVESRSAAIGVNGNRLVYIGGYDQKTATIRNSIYTYDVSSNRWSISPDQQSPARLETAYETLPNDMLYIFGGRTTALLTTTQRVDLTQSSVNFTNLTPSTIPLRAAGSLFDGSRYIYIAGGATDTVTFSKVFERYDFNTGTWTKLKDLPVGASYVPMIIWDNKLHALITNPDGIYRNELYVYDIATDTWEYVSEIDGEVHSLTKTIVHNNELYLIGGWDGTKRLAKVSKFVRY